MERRWVEGRSGREREGEEQVRKCRKKERKKERKTWRRHWFMACSVCECVC